MLYKTMKGFYDTYMKDINMTNHLQCSPTVTDEWIEGAYKIYCDSVCVCVCARAHHGYKFLPAENLSSR